MKIFFTFENCLPSSEADAEVFVTTARYLAPLLAQCWLHVPLRRGADAGRVGTLAGMPVVRARAPVRPGALRHLCCGLAMPFRPEYRQADLVYTRNLWIAAVAVLTGKRVVFDHYRPWSDQIPPLQPWIYRLFCSRRFLLNICHSDYTRRKYRALGIPDGKLCCIRNGFEPERLRPALTPEAARALIGVRPDERTAVYTGRLNGRKGLDLVIAAARRLPDVVFILVGSYGQGPIETMARGLANVRIVAWQPPDALARYVFAADMLLIPPSSEPLARFGSTVLPLKLFLYMASGRPILAGDTPDIREVLTHRENAFLCAPDSVESLVGGIGALAGDAALRERLAAAALEGSAGLTWSARADKIARAVVERAQAAGGEPGRWGRAQSRAWSRQSARWLAHLVRRRSWVLPPDLARPGHRRGA